MEHNERFGPYINTSKTKLIVLSKTQTDASLILYGDVFEQASCIKYLYLLTNKAPQERSRVEHARRVLNNMRALLTKRNLSLELRTRLLSCYAFHNFLYPCENWTFDAVMDKRIHAYEISAYR